MSDLGSRLRMAREEKSLTLDELQSITKIQKRYLAAIEEGDFKVMPGKFYTRAFIKQYAEAVDLEPETLFDEYRNEIPIAYEDNVPEKLTRVQARDSVSRNTSKLIDALPKVLMSIFFIALVVLIWYLVTNFFVSSDKKPEAEQNESVDITEANDVSPPENAEDTETQDKENETEDPADDEETATQKITVEDVTGDTTTYKVVNADKFEVTVKAGDSGEAWIKVTNNGEKVLASKKIANGESETYDFANELEAFIRTGNTTATEIFVNDEPLQYENKNTVQNIIIKFNIED